MSKIYLFNRSFYSLVVIFLMVVLIFFSDGKHGLKSDLNIAQAVPSVCSLTQKTIDNDVFGISITYRGQNGLADKLADLGVGWVRMEFHWGFIEERDGIYQWEDYDTLVNDLHSENINILATIDYIPPHLLRTDDADWTVVYDKYEKFASALINRYKPEGTFGQSHGWGDYGVSYWEVFNEPNLPGFGWLTFGDDATKYLDQYAQFLRLTNQIAHEEDVNAVIMLGGLARDTPYGIGPEDFLKEMYERDAKNCFDIIGYHPYDLIDELDDVTSELNKYLQQYGDQDKPIWFNEFGTPDENLREDYLNKIFEQSNSYNGIFWFTLIDPDPTGYKFGLMNYDEAKNPSYFIFKDLMRKKNNANTVISTSTSDLEKQMINLEKKLTKLDQKFADKYLGTMFLDIENYGRLWYVDPASKNRFYFKDGETALSIGSKLALGITYKDLQKIPVGVFDKLYNLIDSDRDGLPDRLEVALGLNPNNSDTDNDGFTDKQELNNGYNPIGDKKYSYSQSLMIRLEGKMLLQVSGLNSHGEIWYIKDGYRWYGGTEDSMYEIMKAKSLGAKAGDIRKIEVGEILK